MTKEETEQKISQLQLMEQNLQAFLLKKQQLQSQLIETESALSELDAAETAFKIVGSIMVKAKKEELKKELSQKKETIELRITTLEKQEEKIRKSAADAQADIMKRLNEEGKK